MENLWFHTYYYNRAKNFVHGRWFPPAYTLYYKKNNNLIVVGEKPRTYNSQPCLILQMLLINTDTGYKVLLSYRACLQESAVHRESEHSLG